MVATVLLHWLTSTTSERLHFRLHAARLTGRRLAVLPGETQAERCASFARGCDRCRVNCDAFARRNAAVGLGGLWFEHERKPEDDELGMCTLRRHRVRWRHFG